MVDVRVKPLEWTQTVDGYSGAERREQWGTSTPWGSYYIWYYRFPSEAAVQGPQYKITGPGIEPHHVVEHPSLEAAQAAVQSIHDQHVRSTLSDAVAEREAEPVAWAHPDDIAVDRFAEAMKAKLAKKRIEGRGGWDDPDQCSVDHLSYLLIQHVWKGDPLDVGNLAMMLHQRGERIVIDDEARGVMPSATSELEALRKRVAELDRLNVGLHAEMQFMREKAIANARERNAAEARVAELGKALDGLLSAEPTPLHVGYDIGVGGGNYIYTDVIRVDCEEFVAARRVREGGTADG